MPEGTTLAWLVSQFAIAMVALILLDRSHRDSYKKMEEQYKQQQEQNQKYSDSLQRTIDRLEDRRIQRDEVRHGP